MTRVLLCQGTALALPLRDASVHCCVTSPPYYGLRSYGIGEGELGQEPTLEAYVEAMVQVFREVKRVLRPDGTLWLNLGDVYTSGNRGNYGPLTGKNVAVKSAIRPPQPPLLQEKNLLGLPWRVALALQADGWVLRSEIIWHKVNPMPESVQDRPTRSHEQVFLLAKQPHYFYDTEAVKEATDMADLLRHNPHGRQQNATAKNTMPGQGIKANTSFHAAVTQCLPFRNMRSLWSFASEPFSGSHFATFPSALVRRCLLAGCPPGGAVLDPFCGSGTTLLVARELGHHAVGVDLSWPYLHDIARRRLGLEALALWLGEPRSAPALDYTALPLFTKQDAP